MARPAAVLRALLSSTSTHLVDVDPDPAHAARALVRSDHTGTMQLFELDADDELCQLTALEDPVGAAAYLPGTRTAVIGSDQGGNERHQLSIIDLETARANGPRRSGDLDKLTDDPRFGHHLAGVSPDGGLIAYVANKRNGVDFDVWVCEVATREHRCVYDGGGWCQPATGFSPNSRYLSIHRPGPRPLDVDLLVIEVATGVVKIVMEHPDEAALVENPAWVDATTVFLSSNVGSDFARIVRYDLESGAVSTLEGTGVDADAQVVGGPRGTLLVIENDNGTSRLTIRVAAGYVIESSLEKGRGAVATVLVLRGTLKLGDALLIGQEFGRVRALFDEAGKAVDNAGPSIPVVVLGLSGSPNAGDELLVVESERKAREVAMHRQARSRDVKLAQKSANMQDVFSTMGETKPNLVQLLVKADVQGSVEALRDALNALSTGEVAVNVVSSGVGGLTESDVTLAAASKARIIAFNVRGDAAARTAIKEHGVDVRYYSIIYEAIDDIRAVLTGMLAPEVKEQIVGLAEVRNVFRSSKFGTVAGCMVIDGYVRRNFPIRVLRDNVVIFEGALESLKRFKDDVNEVRAGTECGIGVKNYNDVREGDQIECYSRVEVARTL